MSSACATLNACNSVVKLKGQIHVQRKSGEIGRSKYICNAARKSTGNTHNPNYYSLSWFISYYIIMRRGCCVTWRGLESREKSWWWREVVEWRLERQEENWKYVLEMIESGL